MAGNTQTILYTYGNGLVAQEKSACTAEESHATGEYLVYHFNHLGSTTAVTDASGEIRYTYTYNIFGKLLSGNYGEVEFLYNGQYGVASDANGLYYMRARYYNIDIMRFINQDILTGSIDSTQSLNRYAYVEGNPVNFLDPFGLDEYRVDTSGMHIAAQLLDILAGQLTSHGFIALGACLSAFANGFDIGLTINDMYYHIVDKEYARVLDDVFAIALSLVGIITGGIASGKLREIQIMMKVEKRVTNYMEVVAAEYRYWKSINDKAGNVSSLLFFKDVGTKLYEILKEEL